MGLLTKNVFQYGQVGTALDGFRESDIAEQSAHSIVNFYITEMGALRVAKDYTRIGLANNILKFKDTKYNFFLAITTDKIISYQKGTIAKISEFSHQLTINSSDFNVNIFDNFLYVQGNFGFKIFGFNETGSVGTTNFLDTIQIPFASKEDVGIDYYRIYEIELSGEKELRVELMSTYDGNLDLEVRDNGSIYIRSLGVKIDRIYKQYKAAITVDEIYAPIKDMTFMVFKNYTEPQEDVGYYVGNTVLNFTGETNDSVYGSSYYTGAIYISPFSKTRDVTYAPMALSTGLNQEAFSKTRDVTYVGKDVENLLLGQWYFRSNNSNKGVFNFTIPIENTLSYGTVKIVVQSAGDDIRYDNVKIINMPQIGSATNLFNGQHIREFEVRDIMAQDLTCSGNSGYYSVTSGSEGDSREYYGILSFQVYFSGIILVPEETSPELDPDGRMTGTLIYGQLENFKSNIVDIVEYQSRLVIATTDKIYFSKTLDYNNFVPDVDNDSAFFIKPSTINGNQPYILKLTTGTGLYISCNQGIIVMGYNTYLTPANSMSSVRIASNNNATKVSDLIEDDFYYIDTLGQLRCVLLDVSNGLIQFSDHIAEKYDKNKKQISNLSFGIVNDESVLIATMIDNTLKVYTRVQDNLFRNYSLDINTQGVVWGYNEDLINGETYLKSTQENVENARVIFNVPSMATSNKGNFQNDFLANYQNIVMNILNENKAVKGVSLEGYNMPMTRIQNSANNMYDYDIYRFDKTISVLRPVIHILTNKTQDTIEIRAVDFIY